MVFCHEWVQIGDGEIYAMELTQDLKAAAGEPFLLFKASEASWCKCIQRSGVMDGYVTDGPFLWRTGDGTLLCLWASLSASGYTEAVAVSDNGEIDGKFTQLDPLFMEDGGHGMIFRDLSGQPLLTLHTPNDHLKERPVFIPLKDVGGRMVPEKNVL